jgi:2-polyprenyl-3-methyl-5-hydroxy-6-metoxy-1,4-benzoquinol methylase
MKRYRRILSGGERERILRDQCILPSNSHDWRPYYKPETVVFLFDLVSADFEHLDRIPQLHYESYGETWVLECDSDIQTEIDISQSGWPGAVVVRGAVPLSRIANVAWSQYSPST